MPVQPQDNKKADAPDRVFRVIKGQMGPWPEGSSFAESEFKRIHAIPENDLAKAQIQSETYHADLIGRLLALGVISELAMGSAAGPTPTGPESGNVVPSNIAIKQSTERVLQQRAQEQAAMAAPEPVSHAPIPPAAPVQHGTVTVNAPARAPVPPQ